jgi:hypothetical protein
MTIPQQECTENVVEKCDLVPRYVTKHISRECSSRFYRMCPHRLKKAQKIWREQSLSVFVAENESFGPSRFYKQGRVPRSKWMVLSNKHVW